MSDEDNLPHLHGFTIPIPDELFEQRDLARLEATSRHQRIDRFIDGLDVDGLLALRDILNHDSKSAMNNYFDGQAAILLRTKFGVDPWTGLTEQEQLERAATE